ncbi:hypothetical protein [Streptomyces platensis]
MPPETAPTKPSKPSTTLPTSVLQPRETPQAVSGLHRLHQHLKDKGWEIT